MTKNLIGIDSGSTMCKAVLFRGGSVIDFRIVKTGWDPNHSARESMELLLNRNNIRGEETLVAATGYGREALDFADVIFTEITCHALGGLFLSPDIGGVIDIGGQDSKVIQIKDNRVVNFLMNDKCAAGTGRFLSMACGVMGIFIEDADKFANPSEAVPINSMCAVFAESEIISLLAARKDRSMIMSGVLESIARKIQQMAGKIEFTENKPLMMTGGLSRSKVLIDIISKTIGIKVITHDQAIFAGAIGACVRTEGSGIR